MASTNTNTYSHIIIYICLLYITHTNSIPMYVHHLWGKPIISLILTFTNTVISTTLPVTTGWMVTSILESTEQTVEKLRKMTFN